MVAVEDSSTPCTSYLVTTSTEVIFLAQTYRFIYCLDMSPSQSSVDIQQGEILFDEIINCFKVSLEGLCQQVSNYLKRLWIQLTFKIFSLQSQDVQLYFSLAYI